METNVSSPKGESVKSLIGLSLAVLVTFSFLFILNKIIDLEKQAQNIEENYTQLQNDYLDALYSDHLRAMDAIKLDEEKAQVAKDYETLKSDASKEKLVKIESVYALYQETTQKIERNNKVSIDTKTISDKVNGWGVKFLNQEFDVLAGELAQANNELEQNYQNYVASLPKPVSTPVSQPAVTPAAAAAGYSYQSVSTVRGSFGVSLIKMSFSEVQVKTVTANDTDCINNCPVKSLADYVAENNAYAGINGSYFCPPDYVSCAGKTNSCDFPVYNSNLGKWLNAGALTWNSPGLATFSGGSAQFFRAASGYGGQAVTAGIGNFPTLLVEGGNIVVDENALTSYQKTKGTRGALGSDGSNVYLAVISSASVTDAAYVMQALGARDVLNLDGGGSSALYISGAYKVGPGRKLPNAIVLVK